MKIKTVGKEDLIRPAASHDLWIVDERLTFAQYFSSDLSFEELAANFKGKDRPDLLIFDRVHGLRETKDASKVLLVEFKRPGRTNYDDNEDPFYQVQRYVMQLLKGGRVDIDGRPIHLNKNTVFYCYIVADRVGKMEEWTFSWSPTVDGRGRIYLPRDGFNGSIELIEWDSLLSDARDRHRA